MVFFLDDHSKANHDACEWNLNWFGCVRRSHMLHQAACSGLISRTSCLDAVRRSHILHQVACSGIISRTDNTYWPTSMGVAWRTLLKGLTRTFDSEVAALCRMPRIVTRRDVIPRNVIDFLYLQRDIDDSLCAWCSRDAVQQEHKWMLHEGSDARGK